MGLDRALFGGVWPGWAVVASLVPMRLAGLCESCLAKVCEPWRVLVDLGGSCFGGSWRVRAGRDGSSRTVAVAGGSCLVMFLPELHVSCRGAGF